MTCSSSSSLISRLIAPIILLILIFGFELLEAYYALAPCLALFLIISAIDLFAETLLLSIFRSILNRCQINCLHFAVEEDFLAIVVIL